MGVMKRMLAAGWRERLVDGQRVFIHVRRKPARRRRNVAKYVQRRSEATGVPRPPEDVAFQNRYPALFEYLTLAWEAGAARKTATATLFSEEGRFKICLNDRESGCTAWCAGETVLEALDSLEGHLRAGDADWRVQQTGGRGRRT